MGKSKYNQKQDRIYRINGTFELVADNDERKMVFFQGMAFSFDAGSFERDYTGAGESVFTQNGDVLGTGSFNTKNTIDMFSGISPAVDEKTISKWLADIASQSPTEINIVQTFNAPNSANDKFARILMKIRIMKLELNTNVDQAVDGLNVDFEIIEFTSAQRNQS